MVLLAVTGVLVGVERATGAAPREGQTLAAEPRSDGAPFHLHLERSEPANDAVLAATPRVIRLWFSLPPEMAVTSIRVAGKDGQEIPLGKPRRGNGAKDPVEADIARPLSPGAYTVTWKTSSKDGHPVRGDFTFSIRVGA